MKKTEQNKIKRQIKDQLIADNNYKKSDDILIQQLVEWMYIDAYSKAELAEDPTGWTTICKISTASKNIQQLMTKLNLTPQNRSSKLKIEVREPVDLEDVIKSITEK